MYPGKAYSPSTWIVTPINTAATQIEVNNASVFPAGPNIAVIGMDENAETIIYSNITGNTLVGVTRGVEGSPRAWGVGDIIARNWTNKDYATLITNIGSLNVNTNEHIHYALPHMFTFGGKQYRWGFTINATGGLVFRYEEVI